MQNTTTTQIWVSRSFAPSGKLKGELKNPLSMLILGQKSSFLGPTIFKVPQPNWRYSQHLHLNFRSRIVVQIFVGTCLESLQKMLITWGPVWKSAKSWESWKFTIPKWMMTNSTQYLMESKTWPVWKSSIFKTIWCEIFVFFSLIHSKREKHVLILLSLYIFWGKIVYFSIFEW